MLHNKYYKNKLIKEMNREYFKTQNPKSPISLDTDFSMLDINSNYLQNLIHDLQNPTNPKTKFAKDIKNNIDKLNNNVYAYVLQHITPIVKELIQILREIDESYIVGGATRDLVQMKEPKDFDFCTKANLDELENVLVKNGFKANQAGKHFLVLIVSKNGQTFEIANFRSDRDNSGGKIGTLLEDAERRDFGINAGYINLNTLKIVDPTGQFFEDIQTRTVKFVGNPKERLQEDHLRGIRFYRFISRGYNPDKKSLRAIRDNWNDVIKNVNPERIRTEIEKIVF